LRRKNENEEYVTLKVKKRVKDALFEIQGLLQFRDHRRYNLSEIIEVLLTNAPELQIPIPERLRVVEQSRNSQTKPQEKP
jgi:hypothetical protein